MRDVNSILAYAKRMQKKAREALLMKNLRKEVEIGANGTQKYVIKNGANAGKVVGDKFQ
jgi:hypothetical protein